MKVNLVKQPKEHKCDAQRCKESEGLTIVEIDGEPAKLCAKHLELYNKSDVAETEGDQSAVLAIVEPVREEYEGMLSQVRAIEITTQSALDAAGALLQDTKGKTKELEAKRTSVTKPLLEATRNINSWFKPAKEALGAVELALKDAMSAYLAAQQKAKVTALQEGRHDDALAVEQPTMPQGVSARTVWKFEIMDAAAVPVEYLVIDLAKIAKHVNEHKGQSSIPGVRAYPDTGIAATSTPARRRRVAE